MDQAFLRIGNDPKSVVNVEEVKNICPWCKTSCGTLACLLPCEHIFCDSCMYSIIDAELFICPVCSLQYSDFCMDTLSLDVYLERLCLHSR